jgi:hypothetical protein
VWDGQAPQCEGAMHYAPGYAPIDIYIGKKGLYGYRIYAITVFFCERQDRVLKVKFGLCVIVWMSMVLACSVMVWILCDTLQSHLMVSINTTASDSLIISTTFLAEKFALVNIIINSFWLV